MTLHFKIEVRIAFILLGLFILETGLSNIRPAVASDDRLNGSSYERNDGYRWQEWPGRRSQDDIKTLEALGLSSDDDLAYPPDIWLGLRRSFVAHAIDIVPHAPDHKNILEISRKILATGGRNDLLSNSSSPDNGQDFLTLRLQKLNALGAYKSAAKIYRNLRRTPYHPDLALAGITAFLGAGEEEEGCLELWAYYKYMGNDPAWSDINKYCRVLFYPNETASTSDTSSSDPKAGSKTLSGDELAQMKLGQVMARVRLGDILRIQSPAKNTKEISLAKSELLREANIILPTGYHLEFALRAYNLDVLSLAGLKQIYQSAYKSMLDQTNNHKTSEGAHPYIELAQQYHSFIQSQNLTDRTKAIESTISLLLNGDIARNGLHPFLDLLDLSVLEALSPQTRHHMLLAYATYPIYGGREIKWIDSYLETNFLNHKSTSLYSDSEKFQIISAWLLGRSAVEGNQNLTTHSVYAPYFDALRQIKTTQEKNQTSAKSIENNDKNEQINSDENNHPKPSIDIMSKLFYFILDNTQEKSHISFRAYEKQEGLTAFSNYVIKSIDVNRQIHSAAIQHLESQVFLLGLMLIENREDLSHGPENVGSAVSAIIRVGMIDQARSILLSVLAGHQKT